MDMPDTNVSVGWRETTGSFVNQIKDSAGILAMIIGLSAVTIFTIIGNTMVIISIFSYRPLKNVQNMFLVSLASADIAVAVMVMPFSIVDMLLDRWIFGTFLCEMWLTSDVLLCTASILNLCAIALDRYWAIYDPINYAQRRTMRAVLVKITLVWLISGIISIPPILGWNDWPDSFDGDTPCKYSEHLGYVIYSASGSFYVPLVIMSVVYYKIYKATKKRLRERANASGQQLGLSATGKLSGTNSNFQVSCVNNNNNNHRNKPGTELQESGLNGTESSSPSSSPVLDTERNRYITVDESSRTDNSFGPCADEQNPSTVAKFWEEKQRISLSKERRAARILGVVMGVFTICWLPFFIMYLIIPFYPYISFEVRAFITWLGYFNSALNPVIYTIFNVDFRRAFVRQLKCST